MTSKATVSGENVQETYSVEDSILPLFCFHVKLADCSSIETLIDCEQFEKIHLQMQGQKGEDNFLIDEFQCCSHHLRMQDQAILFCLDVYTAFVPRYKTQIKKEEANERSRRGVSFELSRVVQYNLIW